MARSSAGTGKKKTRHRRKRPETPIGLGVSDVDSAPPEAVQRLAKDVAAAGGAALGTYRDPLGGHWLLLVAVPVDQVEPTPYQRAASKAHVERIAKVIEKLERFLDPLILCPAGNGGYWTPNGNHRLQALRAMNARTVTGILVPEPEIAHQILALNTEKAYNLRERALGVVRLLRELAEEKGKDPQGTAWCERTEESLSFELEDPSLLTLGAAYEKRGRFSGGAYQSAIRKVDRFLDEKLPRAVAVRERRAEQVLELDDAVNRIVDRLKKHGFKSPYLKPFVVARVNPLRFYKGEPPSFERLIERMQRAAERFNIEKIREADILRSGGPPAAEEEA